MTQSTKFSAPLRRVVPFLGASCAIAPFLPAPLPAAPFVLLAQRMLQREPEDSRAARCLKVAVMSSTWVGWSTFVAWAPLYCAAGVPLGGWQCLACYAPLLAMAARPDRNEPYGPLSSAVMHVFFDAPLVAAGWACRAAGVRLFAPFATVIDDDIVQGSLPFAADVPALAAAPYNVGAVVNMCREWPGPARAYAAHGIAQLRLPTQDTSAPSAADLRVGAAFIREQLEARPGKRVYVHCKGGIGRASTMTLAHCVVNRREQPEEAIDRVKARRPIVMRGVCDYASIRELHAEVQAQTRGRKTN